MNKAVKIFKGFVLLILLAFVLKGAAELMIGFLYPLKYEEYIEESAFENRLDKYFVMGVIKAESNYDPNAHSGVASGLMQITEDTALWIADKMGIEFSSEDITDPKLNIQMGCYYLKYLFEVFENKDTVLAAYNAGMGNVSKWLKDERYSENSKTLYCIPFSQTREYVKKVNKYTDVYKRLY